MRIMCQVGGCNHTRAGHKWAHSLEVLLTHPTIKFFKLAHTFQAAHRAKSVLSGFVISSRKSPKEQITCDANSNYSEG